MTATATPVAPTGYPPDPSSGRWDLAFVGVCIAVAVSWFALRGDAVAAPSSLDGGWLLGPSLLPRLLVGSVGVQATGVLLALFIGAHLATSTALYVYARPRTGRVVAFGIAVVFLMLGSAGESFASVVQLGWIAATAAGGWALVIVLGAAPIRFAPAAAALLLGAALMSPIGACFVAAASVPLLPLARRHYLWVVVPGLIASVAWLVLGGLAEQAPMPSLESVLAEARVGLGSALGVVSGLGPQVGLTLAVLLALATLATLLQSPSIRLGLVAGSVGVIVEYLFVSLAGGSADDAARGGGLYAHPAAVFILIALTSWLAHRPLDVPGQRVRLAVSVAVLVAVSVAGNG